VHPWSPEGRVSRWRKGTDRDPCSSYGRPNATTPAPTGDRAARYTRMEGDTMAGRSGGAAPALQASDDEQGLVGRVQRGDREAFNELAQRYARPAFAIAYRVLRQPQDAEDLVQDAFIAALDAIHSFDASRPFAPWFFKIVVNRSLNAVSARSTRERHVTEFHLWTNDDAATDFDPAESSEIRARFRTSLAALPKHQRLIVELSDIDGRSSTEIGEMLDLPRGTVRWHLHQARKTLRVALAPLLARSM
jgi:RNA polymerase sigma-70 factor, ECF subfamily